LLEKRLAEVEARLAPCSAAESPAAAGQPQPPAEAKAAAAAVDVNLTLDGSHNNLSINQAALMVERAPNPAAGERFGARNDLHFGQATEAYGGSLGNESPPFVWRHVLQAHRTSVAPVGRGLTIEKGAKHGHSRASLVVRAQDRVVVGD